MHDVNWLLETGAKPGRDRRPILTVNNTYGNVARGQQRPRHRLAAGFRRSRARRAGARAAGVGRAAKRGLFRLSGGAALSKRISVFRDFLLRKVAEGRLS